MSDNDTNAEEIDVATSIRIEALSLAVHVAQPSMSDDEINFEPEPASVTIERARRFEQYIRGQE